MAVSVCLLTAVLFLSTCVPTLGLGSGEKSDTVIASRFGELLFGKRDENADGALRLCPGGDVFGVRINGAGVRVSKILSDKDSTALREGDKIERINGNAVSSCDDVKEIIAGIKGDARIAIIRDGKSMTLTVPLCEGDDFKLGVLMSDSAAGIGTITYINPDDNSFGGLGHGICDAESGKVLPMSEGSISGVILGGASRGECGKPGELRGILTHDTLGALCRNTAVGVFGTLNDEGMSKKLHSQAIPVGGKTEVKEGSAQIISTVKGGKRAYYDVEIFDIDYSSDSSKSFKVKVTDEALIALTGGIVRGMSGSPIIQNGKLVGAVTHVMVANPTEGYGIFIENMLSAARTDVMPIAA